MSKGYATNQERLAILSTFGKELARRAKSRCELCESAGVALALFEVAPVPRDPDLSHCVFLCEECATQAGNPKRFRPGDRWRPLTSAVWSEVPALQVLALRLLRRQAAGEPGADWARLALEEIWLDPAIEQWADREK